MTLFVAYLIPVVYSGEKKVFPIDTWCKQGEHWSRAALKLQINKGEEDFWQYQNEMGDHINGEQEKRPNRPGLICISNIWKFCLSIKS